MTTDKNGRDVYPETAKELDARLDAKNAALAAKIAEMEASADAELARFGPAPAPKAKKADK